jgi:hypothetical protein
MANVTPATYKVTAQEVLFAVTGLAVALALAWISADLLCGGRLTAAITRDPGPPLHVVGDKGRYEKADGKGKAEGKGGCSDCG